MYPIFMTLAATLLIAFGVSESDGIAPLWLALIIFGGAVFGHLITEALNRDQ